MPSSANLLCIGHSHVAALSEAARLDGLPLKAISFWNEPGALIHDDQGAWLLGESTVAAIRAHEGPVFSLVGGASYGVMGMLVHPRRWDTVLPQQPELPFDRAGELIPYGALRETLHGLMREYLHINEQIRQIAGARAFHLEPPPPYEDAARISPHIPWALYPGMCQEVSPAPLRYKLWRLQSDLLKEHCRAHEIGFVAHPSDAANERGFMRENFFLDGAHANSCYGRLVLAQMQEIDHASL